MTSLSAPRRADPAAASQPLPPPASRPRRFLTRMALFSFAVTLIDPGDSRRAASFGNIGHIDRHHPH